MYAINLNQNQSVLLDDEDFARLCQYKWIYRPDRGGRQGYAIRKVKEGKGKYRNQYLHREITNPPSGCEVIFLNHDRLDCRRENLRVVSKEEARRHHQVRRDSKSGIKGVTFNRLSRTWRAHIYRDGRYRGLGSYWSEAAAIAAVEAAVREENPNLGDAPDQVMRGGFVRNEAALEQQSEPWLASNTPVREE
jgi:HNH endonuclease